MSLNFNIAFAYSPEEFPGTGDEDQFLKALIFYKKSLAEFDKAKALVDIKKACEIYPDDSYFWYQYAQLLDSKSEKLKYFAKSASLNKDFSLPWLQIAIIYDESQKYDEAIKSVNKVLENNPNDIIGIYFLSKIYKDSGNFKEYKKYKDLYSKLSKSSNTPKMPSLAEIQSYQASHPKK